MLKVLRLPVEADGFLWNLNAITGSLLKSSDSLTDLNQSAVPGKVLNALHYCNQPYELLSSKNLPPAADNQIELKQLAEINKRFLQLQGKWLIFSLLYAGLKTHLFSNTLEAVSKISCLYNNQVGSNCLQRTLLAAKTSQSFADHGVVFIGANLPTGHMHSWIIEDNFQPDILDRHWISYQPILAIYA